MVWRRGECDMVMCGGGVSGRLSRNDVVLHMELLS